MKKKIRNLIRTSDLIGHLPYGSIEAIAKELQKGRASVRGALTGEWVNIKITDMGLEKIESQVSRLQEFIRSFKPAYQDYKREIKKKK